MSPFPGLALAAAAFVGTHFALSHPLRAPLVARLGEKGFMAVYALVAFATLGLTSHAYGPAKAAAPAPMWDAGGAGWWLATALMWLAAVLFTGSLRGNPALPGMAPDTFPPPRGVFRITRHPMNWAFAIWAFVHALVVATPAAVIVSLAIATLALVGSLLQDRKKEALLGDKWTGWEARTSLVPFARGFALPDGFALVVGTILWLAITWAHGALGYQRAGIFHFFG
ncbi:NnrU family protein [Sphingomonas sp. ASV193]|uniref:NnrU family protein n=1 Tax=Sphingomonas sp. ASV193 TaxID=3144405 RepID=UPI0032E890DB